MNDEKSLIQNYPNHVISALGDKMFFRAQFYKPRFRRLTSGHLSAAADSKILPMNPVTCIVLHLENIAGY